MIVVITTWLPRLGLQPAGQERPGGAEQRRAGDPERDQEQAGQERRG